MVTKQIYKKYIIKQGPQVINYTRSILALEQTNASDDGKEFEDVINHTHPKITHNFSSRMRGN